jgi:hypothetical protein
MTPLPVDGGERVRVCDSLTCCHTKDASPHGVGRGRQQPRPADVAGEGRRRLAETSSQRSDVGELFASRHLMQVFDNSAPTLTPQHPLDADVAALSRRAGEGSVAHDRLIAAYDIRKYSLNAQRRSLYPGIAPPSAGALMLDIVYLHVRAGPAAAMPDAWPYITASHRLPAAQTRAVIPLHGIVPKNQGPWESCVSRNFPAASRACA